MNQNVNLVSALAKYKMDVHGGVVSKDGMKNYLVNILGFQVWSGQKRLVVFDPQDSRFVLKIAYSGQGVQDNVFEVIVSAKLRELANSGQISADDLELFGLADLINGDSFIIKQTAGVNFIQDPNFINWYNQNKASSPNYNENHMFAQYVAQHPQLRADYNRIQEILSCFFKPSDVTIFREPKNYCFKRDSRGNQRLCLIDMGSCIPTLVRNGMPLVPKCEICGSDLVFTPVTIDSNTMNLSVITNVEGQYGCRNRGCQNFYEKINRPITDKSKDSYVFAEYVKTYRHEVRLAKAYYGANYIPDARVRSIMEYANYMANDIRWRPTQGQLQVLFRNYLDFACGIIYSCNYDVINRIPAVNGNTLCTFQQYLQMFNNAISQVGESVDQLTNRVAALHYLQILTSRDNDLNIYDILTQPDFGNFSRALANKYRIDQINGTAIFNAIHVK